jgi:HlyD family secretion protein
VLKGENPADKIQTAKVEKQDIKSTVLATGQVVSETDLNLSFKTSGIVEQVLVKEGEKVKPGQVLARLSQRDQLATLTSARGALAQAQANYNKVLAGASMRILPPCKWLWKMLK